MIQFGYTIFYVKNVQKAISFYVKAFGFEQKFITPDNSYGELNTGNTTLSFAEHSLAQSNLPDGYEASDVQKKAFGVEIGIVTSNVADTLKSALESGALLAAATKTKPWGQEVAYVRDLDGFLVEICSPMS